MTTSRFGAVDTVYRTSSDAAVTTESVQNTLLRDYHERIRRLERGLGDAARDPFWLPIIRNLKRLRFDLTAAPLSGDECLGLIVETEKRCEVSLRAVSESYPTVASIVSELLEDVSKLAEMYSARNPLLVKLLEVLGRSGLETAAVLMKPARHVADVQRGLDSALEGVSVDVLTSAALEGAKVYDIITVCGPPRWFPDHTFTAPRARQLAVLVYPWINSAWAPTSEFISSIEGEGGHGDSLAEIAEVAGSMEDLVDPAQILPSVDFEAIVDRGTQVSSKSEPDEETVVARVVALEPDHAVFLDAGDDSHVHVVDPHLGHGEFVVRALVRQLRVGYYVLLRTSGGGDYIVPVADRIMGERRKEARNQQRLWKILLREQVKQHGMGSVVNMLKEHGSTKASAANVRNWMSFRSIRTADFGDFRAITAVVGLSAEAEDLWSLMGFIDAAHRRAGMDIRRLLLDQIDVAKVNQMQRRGYLEIKLPDQEAGSLGAFLIVAISDETTEVSSHLIGEPFEVTERGKNVSGVGLVRDE